MLWWTVAWVLFGFWSRFGLKSVGVSGGKQGEAKTVSGGGQIKDLLFICGWCWEASSSRCGNLFEAEPCGTGLVGDCLVALLFGWVSLHYGRAIRLRRGSR